MAQEDLEMTTCQQLFARLSELMDGELDEAICSQIQAHLSSCAPCQVFHRTLQETVEICRKLPPQPLPEEVKRELRDTLRAGLANWQQKLSDHSPTE